MNRRTYLTTATGVAAVGFAGCVELDNPDDPDDDGDESESTDDTSEGDGETVEEIDDFEDLEEWETLSGSLSADEGTYYTGSQSALLETAGDDRVMIAREFSETEDFSDLNPGLAVSSEETTSLILQLFDEDGDVMAFRSEVLADVPIQRLNFGISEVDDDVDTAAITEIRISMLAGDTDRRIRVDDLHGTPRPEDGIVLLQLDGGYETHYTTALDVLEEHDLPATAFVGPGRIREDEEAEGDRLTEDQLEALDDAGWTIASNTHTSLDLTDMTEDEQADAVGDAVEWLEDNGYGDGARFVSYPAGRYDESSLDIVADYHDLGFAGRYPASGYITNELVCPRVSDPSADEVERMLSWTAEYGGITSIAYFQLESESLSAFQSAIESIAEYESDGDVRVISPEELESEYLIE